MREGGRPSTLIIGVGNRDRGDDGVGPIAVDRLVAKGIPAVEHSYDGAALIDVWEGCDRVILVDAMRSGAQAGTIRRFDASGERLPKGAFAVSSHLFGPVEAVETARALGRLPSNLIVFGIEGGSYGFGDPLSPAVQEAMHDLIDRIIKELTNSHER